MDFVRSLIPGAGPSSDRPTELHPCILQITSDGTKALTINAVSCMTSVKPISCAVVMC
jgi:hypothetical protein